MVPVEHPSTTSFTPTSDNRGFPVWKLQQQHQQHQQQRTTMASMQGNGFGHRQVRSLTVDEALQYSSLSSIVPHNPGETMSLIVSTWLLYLCLLDIIPLPAISPGYTSLTSTAEGRTTATKTLELLDDAVLSGSKPELLGRTVRDLQKLLDPSGLTKL